MYRHFASHLKLYPCHVATKVITYLETQRQATWCSFRCLAKSLPCLYEEFCQVLVILKLGSTDLKRGDCSTEKYIQD